MACSDSFHNHDYRDAVAMVFGEAYREITTPIFRGRSGIPVDFMELGDFHLGAKESGSW